VPELPEVETVCRDLKKELRSDRELSSIEFFRQSLRYDLPHAKAKLWQPQALLDVRRRAKYIVFDFGEQCLVSHLGMSGSWRTFSGDHQKHDHIQLKFHGGTRLVYNDPRRFGFFHIFSTEELESYLEGKNLGPEPLIDREFNWNRIEKYKGSLKRPIKVLLMDSTFVVGVGNIYASEALHWSRISPLQLAEDLSKAQWEKLIHWIQEVLKDAIALGGSSIRDYSHVNGGGGSFQWSHMVYGRTFQPCAQCDEPISCTVLGGRSTFWCSVCQPLL